MRRSSRNPIKVESHRGDLPISARGYEETKLRGAVTKKHLDFFASPQARAVIERKGAEVVPDIRVLFSTDMTTKGMGARVRGTPGTITLVVRTVSEAAFAEDSATHKDRRDLQVSLYTAHTLLHRIGDVLFQPQVTIDLEHNLESFDAKISYYPPELQLAAELMVSARIRDPGDWLPAIVDTRACREGWVQLGSQALAELVPHLLLYPRGRAEGIRFLPVPSTMMAPGKLREMVDAQLQRAAKALTIRIRRDIELLQAKGMVFYL